MFTLLVTALGREKLRMKLQGVQEQKKGGNCKGGQNQRYTETCVLQWKRVHLCVHTCM